LSPHHHPYLHCPECNILRVLLTDRATFSACQAKNRSQRPQQLCSQCFHFAPRLSHHGKCPVASIGKFKMPQSLFLLRRKAATTPAGKAAPALRPAHSEAREKPLRAV